VSLRNAVVQELVDELREPVLPSLEREQPHEDRSNE